MAALIVIGFFTSLFFLTRTILMMVGLFKSPVLAMLRKYGDNEKFYLPLLPLLVWSGIFLITFSGWASASLGITVSLSGLGIICLLGAYFGRQNLQKVANFHFKYFKYPRWYHNLLERTSRYERRRIAYMWLRLPWRLQLLYNSDDQQFMLWADFVIMGTIMEDDAIDRMDWQRIYD
ncbi:MAG: hypothetical protein K8I60_01765 [Anaerolineae bacterium]|nr:hypothetical protein [Anaerolineae bacterium]